MKNLYIPLLFSFWYLTVTAQESQQTDALDAAVANISKLMQSFPQEKLYLHTDKPYYITGENIYFRAHLVSALSHVPASYSRYVYVDLISPVDSVVQRLKVRPEEGAFFGQLTLPEDMPEGVYKIRAYTNFMRNVGEDYFFSKYVRIGDPNSLSFRMETSFDFDKEKRVSVHLRFVDIKSGESLRPPKVTVRLNRDKALTVKPDKEGLTQVRFNLPHDEKQRVLYVEMEEGRPYKQYIRIPYPEEDYEVSFFPEGGQTLNGVLCNVAFKALKSNGLPEDIEGEIINSSGENLTSFSSLHNGMGNFHLVLRAGETYYAICKNGEGVEKRFVLPDVSVDTYALKVNLTKNKIWVMVNKPEGVVGSDSLYLIAHCRGIVQYAKQWDSSKEFLIFNEKEMPSGILHFLLLSSDMSPISERLVFVKNDDLPVLSINTDKASYQAREKVMLSTEMNDEEGTALKSTFSIAVTDDREVQTDSCNNIYEYLLLSSELRGHIECPACYFNEEKRSLPALDLLMMTQGWRRYDIPGAIKKKYPALRESLELGQEITGLVKGGLLSKPAEGAKVSLFSPSRMYIDVTETDKNGRFCFQGFEFPDSTKYVVQATSKRGRATVELFVDRDTLPASLTGWYCHVPINDNSFRDYIAKADQRYSYENGMRLINLDEVTVKGSYKKENEYRKASIYGDADNTLTEEDIEKSAFNSIRDMLYRFPGVQVGSDYISIRGATGNPLLLIDNIEMDIDMLDILNISDVAQVDLLKTGAKLSMFGSRGANGVISIFTKTGKPTFRDNLMNVTTLQPLGYHVPVEFYAPRYDTQEQRMNETPDLRSTIYWNPCVVTDDNGACVLDFYTADADKTVYSIVIEGVGRNGKIVRYSGKIKRE